MFEPLKDKVDEYVEAGYAYSKVELDILKSAVEGLIKYHENKIEDIIERHIPYLLNEEDELFFRELLNNEYKSIMAIQHWLEDAI